MMNNYAHFKIFNPAGQTVIPSSIGIYVFGVSSVIAGVLDLIWREFEPIHQPVQALGGHIAGIKILVYAGIFLLIAGGIAILFLRARSFGALALVVIYGFFGVSTFPRFYNAPLYLGYHAYVYIGVVASTAEQFILVAAAMIVYWSANRRNPFSLKKIRFARWVFGLCFINFGLAHLTSIRIIASMVPKWIPLSGDFWVVFTGIAFILAGLAVLLQVLDVLATRLLALMLLIFGIIALPPFIFASPGDHTAWGGNAYNLTVMAAAWIMSDWLPAHRRKSVT